MNKIYHFSSSFHSQKTVNDLKASQLDLTLSSNRFSLPELGCFYSSNLNGPIKISWNDHKKLSAGKCLHETSKGFYAFGGDFRLPTTCIVNSFNL